MKLLAAGSVIQMMYRWILTEVALKRNFLKMKSKEEMMGNVCGGDQF